jgi:hypothetical protein
MCDFLLAFTLRDMAKMLVRLQLKIPTFLLPPSAMNTSTLKAMPTMCKLILA